MKLIFYLQISTDFFYKLIVSLWVCMVRHAQSTQSNNFIISLQYLQSSENSKLTVPVQYLKKEDRDEAGFLHADNYQSSLQVDFNTLGTKGGYKVILGLLISMVKHSQITQSNNFANFCNISKMLGMDFIICMQINAKDSKN